MGWSCHRCLHCHCCCGLHSFHCCCLHSCSCLQPVVVAASIGASTGGWIRWWLLRQMWRWGRGIHRCRRWGWAAVAAIVNEPIAAFIVVATVVVASVRAAVHARTGGWVRWWLHCQLRRWRWGIFIYLIIYLFDYRSTRQYQALLPCRWPFTNSVISQM